MKRLLTLVLFVSATFAFISCETETILSVDQTVISFPDAGGSSSVILTANKPWTARSDQSWCKVSPSSGEEASSSKISISCEANPGYDERSCMVTFTCEEKTVAVSVSQSQATGLFVTTSEYALSNEKHTLTVEVKANVEYEVISEAEWIRYAGTKGLSTSQIILEIAANETYDSREGKVSVKQKNGGLSGTVTIRQDSSIGLFVTPTEYNLSNESQNIEVEVKYNVDFSAVIPEDCKDWITIAGTKGLSSTTYSVFISKNETFDYREGSITFKQKNGALSGTVSIRQEPGEIPPAFAIDLEEETGEKEFLVELESGAYILFDQRNDVDVLYYNSSVTNDLKNGLQFFFDKEKSGFSLKMNDVEAVFNKVGEGVYNAAFSNDNGELFFWYGIPIIEEEYQDYFETKAFEEWHKTKWWMYKLLSFSVTALSALTQGPIGWANLGLAILTEAYKSDIWKVRYYIEEDSLRYAEYLSVTYGIYKYDLTSGLVSLLNLSADEELKKIGEIIEVSRPNLGEEWNIVLSPSTLIVPNGDSRYYVNVHSKALWDIDFNGVDNEWCNVEKSGDRVCVSVYESSLHGSHSCFAKIKQAVSSNDYFIEPAILTIVQTESKVKFVLSETEIRFKKQGGSRDVFITASDNIKSWSISQYPEWCSIDTSSTSFTIIVAPSEIGHEKGTIIVTGIVENGGFYNASLVIEQIPDVPVQSVSLNSSKVKFTGIGDTHQLWATVLPEDATDKEVSWISSDPSVVTVDQSGLVTSVGNGSAVVTVSTNDGNKEASCEYTVETEDPELRAKLIKFYKDTGGPNWKRNDNWCSEKPLNEWYGVQYQDSDLKIVLRNNNLVGNGSFKGCTSLSELNLMYNQLQSLDVSGCTSLTYLGCVDNQLQSLDVSGCLSLSYLDCSFCKLLQSLDLSGCKSSLTYLDCYHNQLQSLDVSNCVSLLYFNCSDNKLQYLDVSGCISLIKIGFDLNQLQSIDASGCASLVDLTLPSCNLLRKLNVSGCVSLKSISYVTSFPYQLQSIIASGCIALTSILLSDNNLVGLEQLQSIDISNCSSLSKLKVNGKSENYAEGTQVTTLDASGCTALKYLSCSNSPLQFLNVSGCTSLETFECYNTPLQSLDVSSCASLSWLGCSGNQLQTLDISGCSSLRYLSIYGSLIQTLDVSNCISLRELYCVENQLKTLDVSKCTTLLILNCSNNQLQSLNVSGCTALGNLNCEGNQLQSLDVTDCISLQTLRCYNNRITQMITIEDRIPFFSYDCLYTDYWKEWSSTSQSYVIHWKKNAYGWYYPGEPEKGYHGR